MRSLIAIFVRNPVLANLSALGIIAAGAVATLHLPRETFPETTTDHLTVTAAYPGATPEDVEKDICIKIEQAIQGIPAIWEIGSFSSEGVCFAVAAFDPKVAPAAEVLRTVQDRVHAIDTFPPEARRPIVEESIVHSPVVTLAVHGPAPRREIQRAAEEIREVLLAHPKISQVEVFGLREYEVSIQVSEHILRQHGLTPQHVMESVARSRFDVPAGTIRSSGEEINVRTVGRGTAARDFEDLAVIVRPDGSTLRLGQMAVIRDTFEDIPLFGRVDGEPGVTLHVAKAGSEDTSAVAAAVRNYVRSRSVSHADGIKLTVLADKSRDVDARIDMLIKNGVMGLALLMVCLLVFLDMRAALGVALGIPVAMAGALLVMAGMGSTVNLISLFGLILADAIVLDDSIVIADAVTAAERRGLRPDLAAVEGTFGVAKPVLNASLTTMIMFVPMMFVEGVMGKLIYVLPVVVLANIVASVVEAFLILPAHLYEWRRSTAHGGATSPLGAVGRWRVQTRQRLDQWIELGISRLYRPLIQRLINARWVALSGAAAGLLVCAGFVWGGRTPFVLFPKLDTNTIRARVRFPDGTPVEVTEAAVEQLEQAARALNHDPGLRPATPGQLVRHVHSVIGEWGDYVKRRGAGLCETTVELMPAENRRIDVADIIERWRRGIGEIPRALSLTMNREELGPTDKSIEIRLLGHETAPLRQAADELEEKLAAFAGVFDIDDDLPSGKRELRIELTPEGRQLGLTVGDLARQVRNGVYGGEAARFRRVGEEVKVMVRLMDSERSGAAALDHFRVRTPAGASVPLREVAQTHWVQGFSMIGRQDGRRRVRVQADVDERHANAEQIVRELEASFLPELERRFAGVSFLIDGQRKRINESLGSLTSAAWVGLIVTYAILGAALRSYVQPLILMAAVPLGLAGAVLGHTIMGFDLSLMSVFGMTAVAGIVVNDALVLLDQVNRHLSEGKSVREAVMLGAESRVIAVFLTSITIVAGMAPLMAERSSQALPLIPIAISVTFGIGLATFLTLFIVPALYMALNDLRRVVHWLRVGGLYPAPEHVERSLSAHI